MTKKIFGKKKSPSGSGSSPNFMYLTKISQYKFAYENSDTFKVIKYIKY